MTRKKPRQPQQRRRTKDHLRAVPDAPSRPEDQPLIQGIRLALRESSPLNLLISVSQLLEGTDPRSTGLAHDDGGTMRENLIESFCGIDLRETTAALHVVRAFAEDDLLRNRLAKVLTTRRQPMPAWIDDLPKLAVERVTRVTHVLDDGDQYLLAVRLGSERFTLIVYVDHNLNQVVKDAFPADRAIEPILDFTRENGEPGQRIEDFDPADAGRRLRDALAATRLREPEPTSDTWPQARPFVEWVVRALPTGGTPYPLGAWTDAQRTELVEDYLRSPFAGEDHHWLREEIELLVEFGCTEGTRDPLRWTPVNVEILLDQWLPPRMMPALATSEMPDLLRSFIQYSHARTDIAARWTAETLTAVQRWELNFYSQTLSHSRKGTDALAKEILKRSGIEYDDRSDLERAVGSAEAVKALDDEPLSFEQFDWTGVAADLRPLLTEVVAMLIEHADAMLDDEHLTAELRLLRAVALADAGLFRGRAGARASAAAIVWLIAKANDTTSSYGPLTMGELLEPLGVKSPGDRARRFLHALRVPPSWGGEVFLGSPDYLVADRRAELMDERDGVVRDD